MGNDIYLSIIIPAYNEENRLPKTLLATYSYLKEKKYTYEILVVISKSIDNTVGVVKDIKNEIPNLYIIELPKNLGKGCNVKTGILAASGRIRLFMDADNATDISHFESMRRYFDEGYDIVICSRDTRDAIGAIIKVPQPFYKRFLGGIGNLLIQMLAVRGIWDTQCGLGISRYASKKFFTNPDKRLWFDIGALNGTPFKYRIGIVLLVD
jgi:dolichyl-phosphate beta-glucosyltransferase